MTIQDIKLFVDIDFHAQKVRECKIITGTHIRDSFEIIIIETDNKILGKCSNCSKNFQISLYGKIGRNAEIQNENLTIAPEIVNTVIKEEEEDFEVLDDKVFTESLNFMQVSETVKENNETIEWPCDFCTKSFKNTQGLRTHLKFCKTNPNRQTSSDDIPKRVEGIIQRCQYCRKVFKNKAGHSIHERFCKINQERQYKINKEKMKNVSTETTKNESDSLFKCETCNAEYSSLRSLGSHRHYCKDENKVGNVLDSSPFCSYCKKRYTSWNLVRRHERMYHERRINFTCEICGFGTHSKKTLELHRIKTHCDNPKPFVCDLCTTRNQFGTRNSILYHMKMRHLNQAKYMCETCSRKFICKANLINHIASVHSTNRPFSCPHCDKCFKHPADVKVHLYKIHVPKEKKPQLVCNECDFITHDKHSFARHRLLHLDDESKPFHCKFCNKGFVSQSNQLRHEKTHLDIRPFICSFCEKAFRTKEDLKVHTRYHTGKCVLKDVNVKISHLSRFR